MRKLLLLIVLLLFMPSIVFATNWCNHANNVGCFLMEDSGNESDESGNVDNALTETSGTIPQSATKKFGDYSRDFELDESEYLTHADGLDTDINGADAQITVCFWVKKETDGVLQYPLVKYDTNANQRQYQFYLGLTNNVNYSQSASSANGDSAVSIASAANALLTGAWHHVCATSNDVVLNLYIDGESAASAVSATGGIYNGTAPFLIGCRYQGGVPSSYYDGLIDDVGIWSTALSQANIQDIMNNGLLGDGGTPASINSRRLISNGKLNNAKFY